MIWPKSEGGCLRKFYFFSKLCVPPSSSCEGKEALLALKAHLQIILLYLADGHSPLDTLNIEIHP